MARSCSTSSAISKAWISPACSEVCYGRVIRTKYGYVVQDDNCRRHLKQAKAYFEQIGIPLCGRVAEFEYINMDVCIERARKLAGILNRAAGAPAESAEELLERQSL